MKDKKYYEFYIFQKVLAYKLVFQQDGVFGIIKRTLPSTSGCVWFWYHWKIIFDRFGCQG